MIPLTKSAVLVAEKANSDYYNAKRLAQWEQRKSEGPRKRAYPDFEWAMNVLSLGVMREQAKQYLNNLRKRDECNIPRPGRNRPTGAGIR